MLCRISADSVTSESVIFRCENVVYNDEKEKESIICLRMESKNFPSRSPFVITQQGS